MRREFASMRACGREPAFLRFELDWCNSDPHTSLKDVSFPYIQQTLQKPVICQKVVGPRFLKKINSWTCPCTKPSTLGWSVVAGLYKLMTPPISKSLGQPTVYCIFQVGCPRLLEIGGVISLYKSTTTLQPEVLGLV